MKYKYKESQLGTVVSSKQELRVFSRRYYWEGKEVFSTLLVKWERGEWETTAPRTLINVSLIQWVVDEFEEDNQEAMDLIDKHPLASAGGDTDQVWT